MYLFYLLYHVEYLVLEHLHRVDSLSSPKELLRVIFDRLLFLMKINRLSFSIEHISFVMKKILLMFTIIPENSYKELMNIIESIVNAFQLNQLNLTGKV